MADQDPYEQGAVWIRRDTSKRARILNVFEIKNNLMPDHKPGVWVTVTPSDVISSTPETWTLTGFLNWFERPDGGQPRPVIPQQRTA